MNRHVNTQYLKNKVEAATPIGRILILYEACMRFMTQSKEALVRGDKLTFVDKNIKAQNIIRELRNSLNLDINEEAAGRMYCLYNYMLKQLMQSVRQKKASYIDHVMQYIKKIYMSWKQAEEQGLGRDIIPVEKRTSDQEGNIFRKVRGSSSASYNTMKEGLNLIT